MANHRYHGGAADGDFNNVLNFHSGASPADGDNWYVDDVATTDITLNTDQSGEDYPVIAVMAGATIDIGTAVNPLKCGATLFSHAGSGAVHLYADQVAAEDVNEVILDSPNRDGALYLYDDGGATIDLVEILSGKCILTDGASSVVPDVHVGHKGSSQSALFEQEAGAAHITRLICSGGLSVTNDNIEDCVVNGGVLTIADDTAGLLVVAGGVCYYNSDTTLARAIVMAGGMLDFSKNLGPTTVTIVHVLPGGTIDTGQGQVTFTASKVFEGGIVKGAVDL